MKPGVVSKLREVTRLAAEVPHDRTAMMETAASLCLAAGISPHEASEMLTTKMIVGALQHYRGNQCHAAAALLLHRNTLSRWMQKHGLFAVATACRKEASRQRKLPLRAESLSKSAVA